MYINYGDKCFFEYGRLVDSEHSDTEFDVLYCMPYSDEEDLYQFAQLHVDVNDSWIDQNEVESMIGAKKDDDLINYALGCIDCYGPENFGADSYGVRYDWRNCNKETICNELKHYLIASDNLDIEW